MSLLRKAQFVASVGRLAELPPEGLPEVAFAGRSNVGKSSAINALAGRRKLAFVSKTPGRTQTINFFDLGGRARLVDLPGYGFAQVPMPVRAQWDRLVGGYLRERRSLAALVVLMDARRPFMPHDARMIEWSRPLGCPVLVLLSKIDKLSRRERDTALASARQTLASSGAAGEVLAMSSQTGEGVEAARGRIDALIGRK